MENFLFCNKYDEKYLLSLSINALIQYIVKHQIYIIIYSYLKVIIFS